MMYHPTLTYSVKKEPFTEAAATTSKSDHTACSGTCKIKEEPLDEAVDNIPPLPLPEHKPSLPYHYATTSTEHNEAGSSKSFLPPSPPSLTPPPPAPPAPSPPPPASDAGKGSCDKTKATKAKVTKTKATKSDKENGYKDGPTLSLVSFNCWNCGHYWKSTKCWPVTDRECYCCGVMVDPCKEVQVWIHKNRKVYIFGDEFSSNDYYDDDYYDDDDYDDDDYDDDYYDDDDYDDDDYDDDDYDYDDDDYDYDYNCK